MKNTFNFIIAVVLLCFGCSSGETGVTDKEITLGSHTDLSGPISGVGKVVKMGMELRVKEINDSGGIYGRKIRLIIEDNAYQPKNAIMVTNKMINRDKVFAFVGNLGSPTALATKPIISKKKIPQMFPMTAHSGFFTPRDRYSFGGWAPYYDQARIIIRYFVKKRGKKRIALLYQDDDFGAITMKGLEDQLKEYGMKLIAKESYKRGTTLFSSQVAKLKKSKPDFIVMGTVIRETVAVIIEAKKIDWKIDMCGLSPSYNSFIPALAKKAGFSPNGYYSMGSTPFVYEDTKIANSAKFYKAYMKMHNKPPDLFSTSGYTIINNFYIAAKRAGKNLTRENFIDALETFKNEPDYFGGAPITFTPENHQGSNQTILFQIKKGRWIKVAGPMSYK